MTRGPLPHQCWNLECLGLARVCVDAVSCYVQGPCQVHKWSLPNSSLIFLHSSHLLSIKFSELSKVEGWCRWQVCLSKHLWTHSCTQTVTKWRVGYNDEFGCSNNYYSVIYLYIVDEMYIHLYKIIYGIF